MEFNSGFKGLKADSRSAGQGFYLTWCNLHIH